MCLYSIALKTGRKAKVGEPLTAGEFHHHRCFLTDDGEVACIKPGTEVYVTIKLELANLFLQNEKVAQPVRGNEQRWIDGDKLLAWNGKTVRAKFVEWHEGHSTNYHYTADGLEMADGVVIHMGWLAKGASMTIPRKKRKDAGTKKPRNLERVLKLDDQSLGQVQADDAANDKVHSEGLI